MANEYNYSIIPNTGITKEDLGNQKYLDGPVLPQGKDGSLSVGGWTDANRGFWQQTFLGASIRNFNLSAGFGDSSSSLSVDLVNDEYNKSDGTHLGSGDDVYHNGVKDEFEPPVVGSPVFFKFGQNPATVEQAYRKTFDDTYGFFTFEKHKLPLISGVGRQDPNYPSGVLTKLNIPDEEYAFYSGAILPTPPDSGYHADAFVDRTVYYAMDDDSYGFKNRGENHFSFGGILQTYTENRGNGGAPLYNAKVSDPREILSNAIVLLNNYQGTTFNYKNLINVYGFLEYDPSDELQGYLDSSFSRKRILEKKVSSEGEVLYQNDDTYFAPSLIYPEVFLPKDSEGKIVGPRIRYTGSFAPTFNTATFLSDDVNFTLSDYAGNLRDLGWMGSDFPITGQGFSRRSEKGIPWYRVSQGLASLFNYYGYLPREYKDAGFGGVINFRGYNYVVDFTGLPVNLIPKMYFMDFDQLDLLSLAQEICDITSHDLFVSLLPVIDHPACSRYYWRNRWEVEVNNKPENQIAGIIRLDGINKTRQPRYGAVKDYIYNLQKRNVYVENQDLGFEVSNVTTDKFVVGAQEVEMYYFHNNKDRDELQLRRLKDGLPNYFDYLQGKQWELQTSLSQQIIPFYGFLGTEKAVTIPKGFGPYKQILIDTQSLNAHGVGNYYVATELELRHAAVSYEQWKDFILQYDEVYIQEMSENQAMWRSLKNDTLVDKVTEVKSAATNIEIARQFDEISAKEYAVSVPRCLWDSEKNWMGDDGLPASPCNPPYGYPLYYKRAEKIGIPEAGLVSIQGAINQVMSNYEKASELADDRAKYFFDNKDEAYSRMYKILNSLDSIDHYNNTKSSGAYEGYKEDVRSAFYKLQTIYEQEASGFRSYQDGILAISKSTRDGTPLTKRLPQIARKQKKNAEKVHAFLKSIADECLGKKFLIKIPKACNINYSDQINYYSDFTQNIATGPFGFKPLPIDTDPSYVSSPYFDLQISYLRSALSLNPFHEVFNHYIDYQRLNEEYPAINPKTLKPYTAKKSYTFGALKCNWNPVAEKWDFNYKPEPQGGFFNYALYDQNMSASESQHIEDKPSELPRAVEQGLIPVDLNNLLVGTSRVSAYVRFDNSNYYDFTQVPSDSYVQQYRDRSQTRMFVADVSETLDNVETDPRDALNESFNDISSSNSMDNRLNRKPNSERFESVAYVKCTVDEEFYMTPQVVKAPTHIWASDYTVSIAMDPPTIVQVKDPETGCLTASGIPPKISPVFGVSTTGVKGKDAVWMFPTQSLTEEYEATVKTPAIVNVLAQYGVNWQLKEVISNPSQRLGEGYEDVLLVRETGVNYLSGIPINAGMSDTAGSPGLIKPAANPYSDDDGLMTFARKYDRHLDSWLLLTEKKYLDSDHVYALITLPGKIVPVAEKRFCDTISQCYEPVKLKNILTQDVVRHNDFVLPPPKVNKAADVNCDSISLADITYETVTRAQKEQQNILRSLSLAEKKINYTSPSPVYPDIVALPLMSWERCYGPWQSANVLNVQADPRVRYADIGGKVEFIKDENLAPWNFAGYQLLNEAGALKAQLSNSLLLFSERGGFVYADYPSGIGLAKHLQKEGPLVTSISVDVGTNGLKTTVKMDLYTSRFGKLQKQKEMAISQVARERQKIIDQNNAAIRRGLGKGQANMDLYGSVLKNGGRALINAAKIDPEQYSALQKGKFQNKIKVINNAVDTRTGEFLSNSKTIDADEFDEFASIFPNNNDIRRIEQQNYIQEKPGEFITYMWNGPGGDTDSRVHELYSGVRNEVQQTHTAFQSFVGSFLGE